MNRTERAYSEAKASGTLIPLGDEQPIPEAPEFKYWKVVDNRFPHDRHHDIHKLVVLKRDCDVSELSPDELYELHYGVIQWADDKYDYVKLNLSGLRSVKATPHFHLLTLKPEYK
jgi:hypothetical protein